MVEFKSYKLTDLFDFKRGSTKFKQDYIKQNKGVFPVYASGELGKVDSYDFDLESLMVFNNVGYAGFINIRSGKFNLTNNVTALICKNSDVNITYAKNYLEPLFRSLKKGRLSADGTNEYTTINKQSILSANIGIPIPVNPDGSFNVEAQEEIANKYKQVETVKQQIEEKLDELSKVKVSVDIEDLKESVEFQNYKLVDLFDLNKGRSISKKDTNTSRGSFPVYSAQIDGFFGEIDSFDYDGEYLIWNTDGLGGYIRKVSGLFSITTTVGILLPKPVGYINLDYIKNYIQPIFRSNVKGRVGPNGKNEYTKLNSSMIKDLEIEIPIPINIDGSFNIEVQESIANRYKQIEYIQIELASKLKELKKLKITI